MSSPELSLVFPAHDEQDNIGDTIRRARQTLRALGRSGEIIVVDDGSTDNTARVAAAAGGVRLLQHPRNRGYGAALRTGFAAARGQRVFFSDADQQFDLSQLAVLLAAPGDVVIGYRAPRQDPLHRRLSARAWGRLVGQLFQLGVRDVNCAFKLMDRRVLDSITLASDGAFINTELLVRARAAGFSVHEVPVRHYPRRNGQQSGNRPDVVFRAFWELGRLHRSLPERTLHV